MSARTFWRDVARHLVGGTNRLLVEQQITDAYAAGIHHAADTVAAMNEGCGRPGCAACAAREDAAAELHTIADKNTRSTT